MEKLSNILISVAFFEKMAVGVAKKSHIWYWIWKRKFGQLKWKSIFCFTYLTISMKGIIEIEEEKVSIIMISNRIESRRNQT